VSNKALRVEKFERYYGSVDEVIKQIEDCPKCGAKLTMTHLADHDNMYIHEEVRCMECSFETEETLHILN
jgi:ribosomal protein S27AE